MLKVYVASGSKTEAARTAAIIERLRAAGVHVTYDWTPAVLLGGVDAPDFRDPRVANDEIRAVLDADIVWFLVPPTGSSGGGFEVGLAYAAGKVVACSGPHIGRFHFGAVLLEWEHDEDVFAWILGLVESGAVA